MTTLKVIVVVAIVATITAVVTKRSLPQPVSIKAAKSMRMPSVGVSPELTVRQIPSAPGTLEISGAATFPALHRPRQLWFEIDIRPKHPLTGEFSGGQPISYRHQAVAAEIGKQKMLDFHDTFRLPEGRYEVYLTLAEDTSEMNENGEVVKEYSNCAGRSIKAEVK
jgi:hypothetical protein